MTERLVVIGGGGMGRCVLDVVDAVNYEHEAAGATKYDVVGVVDDGDPNASLLDARGVKFLGPVAALHDQPADVAYVIGIGSPQAKRAIAETMGDRAAATVVHPNAHLGFGVELAPGVVVCSHVSIETNARLGAHVHVNQNATVGHDDRIGDYSTISPLVAVSGNVTMDRGVFVGTGASIRQGTTLHRSSVVGMGAVVLNDVPGGATVVGVPAVVQQNQAGT